MIVRTFISSIFLFTMGIGFSNAQNVEIPDTAFLYALIDEGVDTNEDSLISYDEAKAVKELNISGEVACRSDSCWSLGDIVNLKGIEAFKYLVDLSCRGNKLTSLDVSKNSKLRRLICSHNHLDSLDFTKHYTLNYLDCRDNKLTSLNLSHATGLNELYCTSNQLTSLDVSNSTQLRRMRCYYNPLISLDVSNSRVLEGLYCGNCKLTSLDISKNESLKFLDISNMPNLYQVCVWEMPFPPRNVDVSTGGSPNAYFTTDCTIDIEDNSLSGLLIYPNPTNGQITFETSQPGQHWIEITSLNGQLLYTDKMEGPTHQIDLSSFQKGLYFITVRSRDYVRTEKIIKQ